MEKQRPSDDNSVNHRSVQLSWDSQSSEIDDVEPRKTSVYDELCQEASNGVRDQAVTAASPIGTEFESKFQKLLQNLSGWQGVRWKVSDCSAISRLLTECENVVKSKSTLQQMDVDSEHTLIQKASQILHDLVCLHTPGLVLPDESAMEMLSTVIGAMWNLMFTMYDKGAIHMSDSMYAAELDALLLLLSKYKPDKQLNSVSLTRVLKGALEWLQQLQRFNLSTTDDKQLFSVLQPYLSSTEMILRVQALMVISLSIKDLASIPSDIVFLNSQDMEYIKLQLGCEVDFSSENLLKLLLHLSSLSQNVKIMYSHKLLDSLSLIFETDKDMELEIAAQLIQRILEFESSTETVSAEKDNGIESSLREAIESGDHIQAAKVIRSQMYVDSTSCEETLQFQVNSLEELVFLTGYDIAVCVGQAEDLGSSLTEKQRSMRIHHALEALCQVIAQVGSLGVQRIMSVPYCLDTLCILIRQHWIHLSGALGHDSCSLPLCHLLLELAGKVVMSLTDSSKLAQETVVQWGLTVPLICSLDFFVDDFNNKVTQSRVTSTLLILQNCALEAERHYVYHTAANSMLEHLVPFTKSRNPSISFDAKIISLFLAPYLTKSNLKHLLLSSDQVQQIMLNLKNCIKTCEMKLCLYGATCTIAEVLVWLEKAAFIEENIDLMISHGILEIFPALITVKDDDTAFKGVKLVWTIACFNKARSSLCQKNNFISILKNAPCVRKSKYILHCIQFSSADVSDLLEYANECYEHYKYDECLYSCNKLLSQELLEPSVGDQVEVLKCKALYKVFQRESRLLQMERGVLSSKEFHMREKSCYDKLREVISCLSAALDKGSIDYEGRICLDYGLIDLVRGTNELDKFGRCMLCLKQRDDIRRSHIVPRSILEVFRTGFVQHHGNKGLIVAGAQSSKAQLYHSEKTITKFMLCADCEMLLNQDGEQDFFNNFFSKIYNPSNTEALTVGQEISYEGWLYHFCIGLLFRVIAGFIGIPAVMNHEEVYSLFKLCRMFILDRSLLPSLPKVHLFINPMKVPHEYRNEWINEALVEPAFFDLPNVRLNNGNTCFFPEAHFLIAHLGILNVVVTFSPACDVSMPEQFIVHPNGGVYQIPPEEQRLKFLPEGLKITFSRISENIKDDMTNFLFRREKPFPPVVSKTTENSQESMVGLVEAINADFSLLMKCSESRVNYLPISFHIDHVTKIFQLPPGYSLMVHATISVEAQASHFTYFIGIFNSQQPFVIVYKSSTSETKCFGCLVSEDDLTVKEYISGIPLKSHPSIVQQLNTLTATFSDILPIILRTKGFKDMKMLIYFFKNRMKEVKVLDTKCPYTVGCWFCQDLCIKCMELSAPGFSRVTSDGLSLQFCSEECSKSFTNQSIPLQASAVLINPSSVETNECHENYHKLIFSISAFASGGGKGVNFSLNINQLLSPSEETTEPIGYCAHFHIRQLYSQLFSEFLISSEAVPQKQLVSSNSEMFTLHSSYYTVEQYLLEATKILLKCHENFMKMDLKSSSIPIYLDCPHQMDSYLKTQAVCSEITHHLLQTINSYRIVSAVSLDWSMKQSSSVLLCIEAFKSIVGQTSHESLEHVLSLLLLLLIDLITEMRSCALHQNLKVALLLSTWDLMITMLSDNPAFVGKIKGGLKKLWSSLLGLTRSLDGKDELSMQATFQILQTCVKYEWMVETIDVNDVYNSLECFLSLSDESRLLTLFVLYPLLPKLSDEQKNLMPLTQSDIKHLKQRLRDSHTFHSTLWVMTYALTLLHNVKTLFENGVPELLAEFLEDPDISVEDQENVAQLIENLVNADANGPGVGQSSTNEEEFQLVSTKCGASTTSSFVQVLKDLGNISDASGVVMADSLHRISSVWQPVCSVLNDLNQQECDNLLQGTLMFICQQPECRIANSEDYTAVILLVLDILQQVIKRVHPFNDAHLYSEIYQTLCPLLRIKQCPMLRVQVLFTVTFLCEHRDLEEYFGTSADLTAEDVSVLLTSEGHHFTVDEILTLIEHMSFSSDNCRRLLEGGVVDYFKKLLESAIDVETQYRIVSLSEKLTTQSQQ